MAYTISGTTTRVAWPSRLSPTSANVNSLTFGWWKPTSLVAGRFYLGNGGSGNPVGGLLVASTTSEINIQLPFSTVNGVFTSSGAGIAVNNWYFVAAMTSIYASATIAARLWVGLDSGTPVEVPVTKTTSALGTATSTLSFFAGNSPNLGQNLPCLCDMVGCVVSLNPVSGNDPFGISSLGTITQDEADGIFRNYVLPIWAGQGFAPRGGPPGDVSNASNSAAYAEVIDLDRALPAVLYSPAPNNTTVVGSIAATISGATQSLERSPRSPWISGQPFHPWRRR